jgi:hypothetical protein
MIDEYEKIRIADLVKRSVYSRYRPNFGGYVTFYGRCADSPTGVIRIGGCPGTKEHMNFISSVDGRIGPLSPTEQLVKGI